MAVDKNLFLYDLAVVSIMKNEGPYIKEWLDYHLLAGVDHFYIYDNESMDNQREILQPYIERGIVTYHYYPGKARQYEAYNEAVQNYRFQCRYMAFIDGDEFIFPQSNRSITEIVDEIIVNPNIAGLAINWQIFGSNYQDKADYSRGVLERFIRRAPTSYAPLLPVINRPGGNAHIKTIANPRKIDFFYNPHFAVYFDGYHAVNENGKLVEDFFNNPPTVNKIRINHYYTKSSEEWAGKVERGNADDARKNIYKIEDFNHNDVNNKILDDNIVQYRNNRWDLIDKSKNLIDVLPIEQNRHKQIRVINALIKILIQDFETLTPSYMQDKIDNFLTCLSLSEKLKLNIGKATATEFSLVWLSIAIERRADFKNVPLLFSSMPEILRLNYPEVEDICQQCIKLIPTYLDMLRDYRLISWKRFTEYKFLMELLKSLNNYKHK